MLRYKPVQNDIVVWMFLTKYSRKLLCKHLDISRGLWIVLNLFTITVYLRLHYEVCGSEFGEILGS